MNKEDVEYIYSVMLLNYKKDKTMSFAAYLFQEIIARLGLEIIILSEVNERKTNR